MHRRTALLTLLGLAAACATPPPPGPVEKMPWPGTERRSARPQPDGRGQEEGQRAESAPTTDTAARAAVAAQRDAEEIARLLDRDPKAWATRYPKTDQCEAAARAFHAGNAERSWRALRACTTRATPFKNLGKLTDGFWDDDLRTRADAPVVLAAVIAARGADIVNDVEALQRRRIPLFSLEIAKANPAMYRGRPVIFTSAVENVEPAGGGKATARLALIQTGSVGRTVVVSRDEFNKSFSSASQRDEGYNGSVTTTRYDNRSEETDEIVLGRLTSLDPFFAPGRRFVVVGRFDGFTTPTATADEPEPEKVPVISVYAYFEPGAQTALTIE